LRPNLEQLLLSDTTDPRARAIAANALSAMSPNDLTAALAGVFADGSVSDSLRTAMAKAIVDPKANQGRDVLRQVMRSVPHRLQVLIADHPLQIGLERGADGVDVGRGGHGLGPSTGSSDVRSEDIAGRAPGYREQEKTGET